MGEEGGNVEGEGVTWWGEESVEGEGGSVEVKE